MQSPQRTSRTGFRCGDCGFELYRPIAELSVSTLGLYDDARFPGRCLLALNDHAEHFEDLPSQLAVQLASDVQRAARAIREATGVPRINIAILGNVAPHIHVHLVPRGGPNDPLPGRSPWSAPEDAHPLDAEQAARLSDEIAKTLVR